MAISTIDNNGVNLGQLGNRNLIQNGNFSISQRGTSFTADNVYTLDRWKSSDGTGGSPARTLSQQVFTLGQTDVPNAHYYLRHAQTGASTNGNSSLVQKIEDVTRSAGQTITLSFYAKANASMTVDVRFIQDFGSGGSPSSDVTLTETITIGTSWTKFTLTKAIGSLSGKTLGTDGLQTSSLTIDMEFQPTGTFTFELAQVQLEVGDTATPFEHRSYGAELALCQRYFQYVYDSSTAAIAPGRGASGGDALVVAMPIPVVLRATPAVASTGAYYVYDPNSRNNATPTSVTVSNYPTNGSLIALYFAFSGVMCDDDRVLLIASSGTTTLTLDAEL